jgi:hypothetical protein
LARQRVVRKHVLAMATGRVDARRGRGHRRGLPDNVLP